MAAAELQVMKALQWKGQGLISSSSGSNTSSSNASSMQDKGAS